MVLSYLSPQRAERPRDFLKCATRSAKQTCTTSSACWNPVLFNGENFLKNLVFVVIEHASRRLLHANVTAHPTAAWTLQQLREAIPSDHRYRFLIHDRDSIFSQALDQCIRHLGCNILKTPVRTPVANAICERVLGTLRRECLDFMIPLSANHLRRLLTRWVQHHNGGRPHMSLGPGIPQPSVPFPAPLQPDRHRLPAYRHVASCPILGGLHHEYGLEGQAA